MEKENIDLKEVAFGNPNAFRSFFIKYYPKVKRFIYYFIKSEEIAEDLSQDVFEYIWVNRNRLPGLQSLDAYLFCMAKNKALNYLSRQALENAYAMSCPIVREYSIEEELYAAELEMLILLIIEKMPGQRRRIFEMSRYENLKNQEIADLLHLSKKTVENHLNLALKQLRKEIFQLPDSIFLKIFYP